MISNRYASQRMKCGQNRVRQALLFCNIFTILALCCPVDRADARPEYALRLGVNRCTNCHYSPAGGGPRNLNGKYYGAHGFELSPFSAQPYAGADIRFLYYNPSRRSETSNGLAAMSNNIWASLPLYERDGRETRIVAEHNLGGFSASGARSLYVQFGEKDQLSRSILPQYIMFGRFIPAFGIMTDEHRTYARMQSMSEWNMNGRMGLMLAANPLESLHYDLAILNGQANDGTTLQTNEAAQWSGVANLRWLWARMGGMVGVSGEFFEAAKPGGASSSARAVYTGWSLHRLTRERVKLTLLAEYDEAVNMNGTGLAPRLVYNDDYRTSVANTASSGWYVQANYDISENWQINYKFDQATLDKNFPSDHFDRHGIGFKHFFGPNMWTMWRYEFASSSVPVEKGRISSASPTSDNAKAIGTQDAFWAVVTFGI